MTIITALDGCVEWAGPLHSHGYGLARGHKAHRVAWISRIARGVWRKEVVS